MQKEYQNGTVFAIVDIYDRHGRIHGHTDQAAAIDAVADEAFAGIIDGRDVLVLAPTNRVVDELNVTLTDRLARAGWPDPDERIEIGSHVFHPGQPVVTRSNDRTLTYGPGGGEWVSNGDRWIVNAGTSDEMYLTNLDNGHSHAVPAGYVEAGNLTVDYASTINRAQGATVDEAHLIIDERTNAKQLYVGMTRGRQANHVHAAPPAVDPDQHGPNGPADEWSATGAVATALMRQPAEMSAIGRRRTLRELSNQTRGAELDRSAIGPVAGDRGNDPEGERIAAAMCHLQQLTRRTSARGLQR